MSQPFFHTFSADAKARTSLSVHGTPITAVEHDDGTVSLRGTREQMRHAVESSSIIGSIAIIAMQSRERFFLLGALGIAGDCSLGHFAAAHAVSLALGRPLRKDETLTDAIAEAQAMTGDEEGMASDPFAANILRIAEGWGDAFVAMSIAEGSITEESAVAARRDGEEEAAVAPPLPEGPLS